MEWTIEQVDELEQVAQYIIEQFEQYTLFLLNGEMGAGKTTLTSRIVKLAGSKDAVSSPTYSIVNTYELPNGKMIYHFDLYRIEDPSELEEIGFYEYLDSGNICIIEWPERAEGIWQNEEYLKISIEVKEGKRIITFEESIH